MIMDSARKYIRCSVIRHGSSMCVAVCDIILDRPTYRQNVVSHALLSIRTLTTGIYRPTVVLRSHVEL